METCEIKHNVGMLTWTAPSMTQDTTKIFRGRYNFVSFNLKMLNDPSIVFIQRIFSFLWLVSATAEHNPDSLWGSQAKFPWHWAIGTITGQNCVHDPHPALLVIPNSSLSGTAQQWKQIWKLFYALGHLLLTALAIGTCFCPATVISLFKKQGVGTQMLRNVLNLPDWNQAVTHFTQAQGKSHPRPGATDSPDVIQCQCSEAKVSENQGITTVTKRQAGQQPPETLSNFLRIHFSTFGLHEEPTKTPEQQNCIWSVRPARSPAVPGRKGSEWGREGVRCAEMSWLQTSRPRSSGQREVRPPGAG